MTVPACPFDQEFFADPYPAYAAWRAEAAAVPARTPDGAPVWLVSREYDVRAALADPRLSVSKRNSNGAGYRGFALPPALDANLLNLDAPDHTRLRRLVTAAFTPRRMAAMRPMIQAETARLLDRIAVQGGGDVLADLAFPLPLKVIGELLGVPEAGRHDFDGWTTTLIAPDPDDPGAAVKAIGNMQAFLVHLVAEKRKQPAEDLLSALVSTRDSGERVSEDELVSLAFLLLWTGYENPVHLIGNGVLALLRHPEQLALLREGEVDPAQAVEELLRYDQPYQFAIRRFPIEDIEIGEVTIPAGDTVLLAINSANRDQTCFTQAERLDLRRGHNPHLAFGHGPHHCPAAPLARIEAEETITALVRRFPKLRLAVGEDELRWRPSWRSHSLRALPVEI
ncbi:cytochrome P450 family protein [Crossiella cryophila]|uniref:Cytochrome P450 n=1 Tax=Crossiella cryophila TaxID=43355 RepID=A0A7W7CJU9_9PSEU|nr:cytochrome P450 [Crossiella cryophila]MBB4681078.1 cytochrome P450 [Crossiella cryophila]